MSHGACRIADRRSEGAVQAVVDGPEECIGRKRFDEDPGSVLFGQSPATEFSVVAAAENDAEIGAGLAETAGEFAAIQSSTQDDIRQEQFDLRFVLGPQLEGRVAGFRLEDPVAVALEHPAGEEAQWGIVFDEEDALPASMAEGM